MSVNAPPLRDHRIRSRVSGRVQGVYFRASTRDRAESLGLTGWVRNLPDGRVELEAQGAVEQLRSLAVWLREGPAAARVDSVETEDLPAGDATPGFEIRR